MKNKLNIFLLVLMTAALVSCGDDDEPGPAPAGTTTPVSTQNAFETVNNTLTSLATTLPTATCDATTGATTTTVGSATFVTDKIFCSLNASANTTSSVRNGYSRSAGMLCSVIKTSPLQNDATTPTVHENITVSETDPCFTAGGVDLNADGDTADTVPVSFRETTGGNGDYDTKIEMQTNATTFNTTGTSDTTLFTKNSADISASKSITTAAVTEAVVKRSTGEVFYENRDYTNSNHTRLYAKGALNTNGTIGTLTNLQAIEATGNAGSEADSVIYATDGTNTYMNQFSGTTAVPGAETCTTATSGGTADCTALTIPYNAGFHDFTGNPATNFNNGTMMSTTAPITMSF